MQFTDHLTIDAPRAVSNGLAVRARAARTGVYEYTGRDVDPQNRHGLRDKAVVHVLRDENTVFDAASVRSFIGKPITDDHPSEHVTPDNWRDHARGMVMGAIREGEYLAFDLLLTDAEAIAKVRGGKRELSNGYDTEREFGSFTAADGTVCEARQTAIFGNHVALVDRGRAGPECRIGDSSSVFAVCDSNPARVAELSTATKEDRVKVTNLDGLSVNLSDAQATEQALATLDNKLTKALNDAKEAQTAHDKALATKDAEIDDLRSKIVDQAAIDALADAKADIVAETATLLGDGWADTKGKSVSEIRRMAVVKRFGDAAVKDKSADYIDARYDAMVDAAGKLDDQRPPIASPPLSTTNDNAASVSAALRFARYN